MSPDPTDYVHPSSLSDEDKAAMRAADPAAFDDDEVGDDTDEGAGEKTPEELAAEAAAAGKTDEGKTDPTEEEKAAAAAAAAGTTGELTDEQKAAAAAGVAAGKTPEEIAAELAAAEGEGKKKNVEFVPMGRFNEVLSQLNQLKEFKNTISQAPAAPKDFDAEFKAIQDKYDAGDLTLDERLAEERALGREEAQYTALVTVHQANNANALTAAENDWTQQVGAWSTANAEFLSNPIRKDAVGRLMDQLGADATLSNEALLEKVQQAAFEAFNWKVEPVTPADKVGDGKDPHAQRRADNAAATAAASAVPGQLNGGVGGRGGPEKVVDLDNVKPGSFSKSLTKEQQEKLLGEGAL